MTTVLVSVACADRTGLVAAITGRLFDLGANLGDTAFAAISGRAEFSSVADIPAELTAEAMADDLRELPELAGATVEVTPFGAAGSAPSAHITHRIELSGGDRPGLLARLSEVFGQYNANIVRLNAQRIAERGGHRYVTRFAVSIPERGADACLATVANTAGELNLACHWEEG